MKSDFDQRRSHHGTIARHRGAEAPAAYRVDSALIQTQPGSLNHADVGGTSVQSHIDQQQHGALKMRLAGILGVLRLLLVDKDWMARDFGFGSAERAA